MRGSETAGLLTRFGSTSIQDRDSLIVLGGVGCDGTIVRENDIVVFSTSGLEIQAVTRITMPSSQTPRPLLIGSSVVLTDDREIVIIGGAATCFSMGTFCRSKSSRLLLKLFVFAPACGPGIFLSMIKTCDVVGPILQQESAQRYPREHAGTP